MLVFKTFQNILVYWVFISSRASTPLGLLLALVDYVSRAHEIEICLSVVRLTIISEPNARIAFSFHLWLLLDYLQRTFLYLKKKRVTLQRTFLYLKKKKGLHFHDLFFSFT